MKTGCPANQRAQRLATMRLAKAFRTRDAAEALLNDAGAELDEAFRLWSIGQSVSRDEARAMLEMSGLLERQPRCATSTQEPAQ